jgi:hypothetical protein
MEGRRKFIRRKSKPLDGSANPGPVVTMAEFFLTLSVVS